ncbi:metallopeptidase family protein [Streptantibioticus silvisoli]|uniref:Metallopeptidase family protein n=1 Tax=Streptantibioticus silvisoli TaxID=2705255 RepID=A0ABT6W386_9ACTN|nr:metallopeptidase family protein [Streptantibioticus silvisoli]MDI5965202.1 metallopeptidase family protein [Streptantibioticus silvisoli]
MDMSVPPHAPGPTPGPHSGQASGQPSGQPSGAASGPAPGQPSPAVPGRPVRRRDRHGRGMRGPVAPPQVPLSVSRSDAFDDLVRDAADRLERRWPQLAEVEFAVQEVPPPPGSGQEPDDVVPLGRLIPAGAPGRGSPNRIVVYRRPVEVRAKGREERALLVHEVVVEQVAELLGLSPESVDPRYGEE